MVEEVQTAMKSLTKVHSVTANFWRRPLALGTDFLILGAIGFPLGEFWGDQFALLGSMGKLVGYTIALLYFSLFNSRFFQGQTLGKRLFGLVVVDKNRNFLSVHTTLLRSLLLLTPLLLAPFFTPTPYRTMAVSTVINGLLVGWGSVIMYLYIFNRQTRQSLHDLLCGSFVIRKKLDAPLPVPQLSQLHKVIAVLILITAIASGGFVSRFGFGGQWEKLARLQAHFYQNPDVSSSNIRVGYERRWRQGQSENTRYLDLDVYYKRKPEDFRSEVEKVWGEVHSFYTEPPPVDSIRITVAYGYDIGIARNFISYRQVKTISEW